MSAKLKAVVVISELCESDSTTILTFHCVICEILLLALLATFSFNTVTTSADRGTIFHTASEKKLGIFKFFSDMMWKIATSSAENDKTTKFST